MILAIVQAHPSRREFLPRLLSGLEPMPFEVVETDFAPPDPWRGYLECLRHFIAAGEEWTHAVVLQDDALVCRNFPPAVERIAQGRPDNIIALFLSGGGIGKATFKQPGPYCRLLSSFWIPVVGAIWPRALAAEILDWTPPRNVKPNPRSDDGMVGLWAKLTGKVTYATRPSLVQHPDDLPSTIGKLRHASVRAPSGDPLRTALEFIGDRDPLDFDWSA